MVDSHHDELKYVSVIVPPIDINLAKETFDFAFTSFGKPVLTEMSSDPPTQVSTVDFDY